MTAEVSAQRPGTWFGLCVPTGAQPYLIRRFIYPALERAGSVLADADLMIASIAVAQDTSLVTGNRKHYDCIEGLRIEDWIRGQSDLCRAR
jgi:hypothetical protein